MKINNPEIKDTKVLNDINDWMGKVQGAIMYVIARREGLTEEEYSSMLWSNEWHWEGEPNGKP